MGSVDIARILSLLWDLVRTLLVVGVIVFFHELGHFLAAKKVGIKVDRFSIGFGPRLLGFKRGETEYWISWFPIFGGYVKMAGENPAEEVKEKREGLFSSAPVSHRAIVAVSGPGMNMIFAVLAFTFAYMIGLPPDPGTTIGYVEADSPAAEAGIIPGDKILSIDGYKVRTWDDIRENVSIKPEKEIKIRILRNGSEETTLRATPEMANNFVFSSKLEVYGELDGEVIPENLKQEFENFKKPLSPDAVVRAEKPGRNWIIDDTGKKYTIIRGGKRLNVYEEVELGRIGISPVIQPVIGELEPGSPADEAGFQAGDIIEAVNGNRIGHISEFFDEVEKLQASSAKEATLKIRRGENTIDIAVSLELDENDTLAFLNGLLWHSKPVSLNPIAAFAKAVPETIRMGGKIFQVLKRLIIREVPAKYVAGPVGLVQITMAVVKTRLAGIFRFAGILSINLAIVNLIPLLFISDGAMLVFLGVEKLRGKPLEQKRQIFIQQVGVSSLIVLFLLLTFNDILRWIRGPF